MEMSDETPIKKSKRLTSVVWNHFERVRRPDGCYAVCVHCKKKLSGSSNSGTTHLRNHLLRCLKRSNFDVSQILSAKRKRKESAVTIASFNYDGMQRKDEPVVPLNIKFDQELKKEETINLGSVKFDQERSRQDLARMIILHDYPLNMVEHVGFRMFVKNLQPLFEVMTHADVELDCMAIYGKEKHKVYELIHNMHGRISLAVGMWASPENMRYFSLSANYIGEDWELQRKLLNFMTLDPSFTDEGFSNVLVKCLMDWDVDHKLFSMTLDDCFDFDDIALRTKDLLTQNKPLLKNGDLFDMRCAAHLVKSIVQDVMEAIRDLTQKVRESVRNVNCLQATQVKFNDIAQQLGIAAEKRLVVDCPTRWNSTYYMLEAALEYRAVFSVLQEHDSNYEMHVSETEWEWVSSVITHMKLLVEIADAFAGNKHMTSNIYFPEICDIHIQLIDWCKSPDDFVSSIAVKMKEKFDKYWTKCSLTLALAAILDPRFKMKLVEYYYPQIYGTDASDHIREVSNAMRGLFKEYSAGPASLDQGSSLSGSSLANGSRDRLRGFDKFLSETSLSDSRITDLDKYLEEPVFPRNYDFNILNWWRVHTPRYPVLAMMARDILGVPVSTLDLELAFSTSGRMLDRHLTSLSADTREALICGHDWLRMESEGNNPSSSLSVLPLAQSVVPLAIETS